MDRPHAVGFMYDEAPALFNCDVKHFSESYHAGLCRGRQTTCLGLFEDHDVLQMSQNAGTSSVVRLSQQCKFSSLYIKPRIFFSVPRVLGTSEVSLVTIVTEGTLCIFKLQTSYGEAFSNK